MENKKLGNCAAWLRLFISRTIRALILLFATLAVNVDVHAATKTSVGTGNWSNPATWSPSGVPANTDSVVIHGGDTLTVDAVFTCNNLDLGDSKAGNTNLNITATGNSLTINGNLRINPSNLSSTYNFDAGPGAINVAGTFSSWSASGTSNIKVASGMLTFTPAVTIATSNQTINIYGAGVVNFNSSYTDNYNKLLTYSGCVVNFNSSYTVNTTAVSWNNKGKAVFSGTGSITPNANITLWDVQMNSTAAITLNSGAGLLVVSDSFTLASGSAFTANQGFELDGNWTNNGGTLGAGSNTIIFGYWGKTIGGTASTAFPIMQFGKSGGNTAGYTMTNNNSCAGLVFTGFANSATLTLGNGDTLSVNGNVTINQPTAALSNALLINGGNCRVSGNLAFVGTSNTSTYIGKVAVTTGSFTLAGGISWMANTTVGTELITVGSGTITFLSSVSMGTGSGTLSLTGTGAVNFNGPSPSFTFGDVAGSPALTTSPGSTLNISHGFINYANALALNVGSNVIFTGNGTITPNAAITFGNVQFNASVFDTLSAGGGIVTVAGTCTLQVGASFIANQNFEVDGNWTNNGGSLMAVSDTVTLGGGTQLIGGTTPTAFPTVQIGNPANAAGVVVTMSNNNSCNYLLVNGFTKARTLNLATGIVLTVNNDVTLIQPTAVSIASTLGVNGGICNIGGNLNFSGLSNTVTEMVKVNVTNGSLTVNGNVNWMANTAVATEVISVSTGTITFANPLTMGSGSGTLSVTSTGTINFNGTAVPSFNFGGSTGPVLNTYNGCTLNFASGFTNNSNALTFIAGSNAVFNGSAAIIPNAAITFSNVSINGANDTLSAGSATAIVAGSFTLASGSVFLASQNMEVRGNWINNGGTLASGCSNIIMNGTAQTIGGTLGTIFPVLQIGATSITVTVVCTMNNNCTCSSLVFNGYVAARTFTQAPGTTLTVTGDVTINQPTAGKTNLLQVDAGTCSVGGNLNFTGTNNSTSYIARAEITTGSFTVGGNVNWMSNTAILTEVISVTTGTLTFSKSLTMGSGSGTLSVTGAATVNFNGTTAPSFNFGGSTGPNFYTAAGCTLNFKNGFTNNSTALILANLSNTVFTGNGTLTPTAAITFGNVQINAGDTLTLAGLIFVTDNWTDNGGFVPGTNAVTFDGPTSTTQTITKTGGETFYKLSGTTAGATMQFANNVIVTNLLTMSGHNINLNGNTLTLGSGAGASLAYTTGVVYGGTWKRWLPVTSITSNSSLYYGLIPIGSATSYQPFTINSTSNPTTAGYIMATHIDSTAITIENYTDNEGSVIQAISDMNTTITTSGLAGGTYTVTDSVTGFASSGSLSDLKLETFTGGAMGSVGTTVTTTGTVTSPKISRSGLSVSQLANVWVIGTKNINSTPLRNFYYSRKSGNWDDVTPGSSTWSLVPGGSGTSCNCVPASTGYVTINPGHTVTADLTASADYLNIDSAGVLNDNGIAVLTVNKALTLYSTGKFNNSSTWNITGTTNFSSLSGSGGTGTITLTGTTNMPAGAYYTQTGGTLNIAGDLVLNGNISLASAQMNLTGSGNSFSGNGNIINAGSGAITVTNNKTVPAGSNLTIGSGSSSLPLGLSGTLNFTNNGSVTIYGNLTGTMAGSTWINAANSSFTITGNLLNTGTLTAAASPNTITYNGSGAQTINAASTGYYTLLIANGGTKTLGSNVAVTNTVTIQDSAVLDMSTYALTGNADLYMSGKSELRLTRGSSGYYPEINGNYYLTGGTVTINQTSGTATINDGTYYNLKFTGSQPYDISGVPTILNNFYLQGSSTFINNIALTVADSFNYASTGSTTLNADITAGSVTISAGTLNDGGNVISVTGAGGWNNNGGTFTALGQTIFSGNKAQQIGGSQATSFYDLTMNNSNGVTLNVNPPSGTIVTDLLRMINGVLNTTATNIITINDNAGTTGGSVSSYINGPAAKIGNENFIFPLGASGRYRAVGITAPQNTTTQVTAQYFFSPYTTLTPVTGRLYRVSPVEYWMINRTVTTDSIQLALYWQGASASNITNCALTIAHYVSGQWKEEPATATNGSACSATGSGSVQTNGYISSFSPFTFGDYQGSLALPVELVSFEAAPQGSAVLTHWSTAMEINNAYFTVEKSADGMNFSEVGKVDGAGNSTSMNEYQLRDEKPLPGTSYYRLLQTDFNGQITYFDMVTVEMPVAETSVVSIYPNPSHDHVSVSITKPSGQIQLKVFDVSGWEVYTKIIAPSADESDQTFTIPTGIFAPGVYLVSTTVGNMVSTKKLVMQ